MSSASRRFVSIAALVCPSRMPWCFLCQTEIISGAKTCWNNASNSNEFSGSLCSVPRWRSNV
eukprot:5690304-Pyramimonas_sp.AAC.1